MTNITKTFTIADKKVLKNFSNKTGSCVKAVTVNVESKEVLFFLEEYTCVDIRGAIEISTLLLNDVKTIMTHSGEVIDYCYELVNGKWETFRPCFIRKPSK